jgi:hypothetical protein
MGDLSQADFARAARGAEIFGDAGQIEQIMGGLTQVAKCAVRDVHRKSPAAAVDYFDGKTAKWLFRGGWAAATVRIYRVSLSQYIDWDGGSGEAERFDVGFKKPPIVFAPGDSVRAQAHIVRDLGGNKREARVLLWDDVPLDEDSAEMIALPVVERINNVFGAGSMTEVGVWHLAQPRRFTVLPAAAEARRADVQTLLAQF